MVTDENNNESDEEEDEDLFDSICAICDNGGDLLWYVQSSIRQSRL
jgi:hypothetical protein